MAESTIKNITLMEKYIIQYILFVSRKVFWKTKFLCFITFLFNKRKIYNSYKKLVMKEICRSLWNKVFCFSTFLPYLHSEKRFDWIKKIICMKHFLWCKEMFCLNETKFVWFKQNIFGSNKYLFESNKFLP